MRIFAELGKAVQREYKRAQFAVRHFPKIAAEALQKARIVERTSSNEVVEWVLKTSTLPPQNDLAESFGEPPITVYRGEHFHIEVLFWVDIPTTVHGHGFSGAFQAFSGSRLQTRHHFEAAFGSPQTLLLGNLHFDGAECLHPGDVVEISPALVHSVVHLEQPSATLVVRTGSDQNVGPQFDYRAPGLAIDPFLTNEIKLRQIQTLRLLCRTAPPTQALSRACELIARSDEDTSFRALELLHSHFGTFENMKSAVQACIAKHGENTTRTLLATLREDRRLRAAAAVRRQTANLDERFVAAILHHVPHRKAALELIKARFPKRKEALALEQLAVKLASSVRCGVNLTDPVTAALFKAKLRTQSPGDELRVLARVFSPAEVQAGRTTLLKLSKALDETVFAPLFRATEQPPMESL
ncbi:MAG: hypothetical protein IPK82_20775 [Polyangiaceae bacterium]|nr:hypothetical protein [Polyangiaceae bacterium]